jgi:Na+/H+ antiporter NhaA
VIIAVFYTATISIWHLIGAIAVWIILLAMNTL